MMTRVLGRFDHLDYPSDKISSTQFQNEKMLNHMSGGGGGGGGMNINFTSDFDTFVAKFYLENVKVHVRVRIFSRFHCRIMGK